MTLENDTKFGHGEFGKFSPKHSKVAKSGLSRHHCIGLKFTGELCVMIMKKDAKFEQELTCKFKFDMRNFLNFDHSTQKISKIYTLIGCF